MDLDRSQLVKTLAELVAIPSVNPMGRPLEGPELYEHRLTDYLGRFLRDLGLPTERQPVEPRRDNIIARLDGDPPAERGGAVVLFEAHQDTVPVDDMTIDPWRPEVRDGRMYGRGACDIKGGMAAMLGALERLTRERPRGMPTLLVACTINEEYGFTGARALARLWSSSGTIFPRRPDLAIVAEPTDLNVVVAHKGVVRWRCHTRGRAVHSSEPARGVNAIFKMAAVLAALEQYQREIVGALGDHPLCGRSTLSVGTIQGGLSVNTVPARCTIEIDRRLVPGESPEAARRHIIEYLERALPAEHAIEHDEPFVSGPGLSEGANVPIAERLVEAARTAGVASRAVGVPYGTNAASIAAAGVPSVVFGPGSILQAHTADEWLDLDQLHAASEVLYQFLLTFPSGQ